MPLYEYQCLDCQDVFQQRRSFAEATTATACPSCESDRTRKVFGAVMVLSGNASSSMMAQSEMPAAGGCCGGHCGCAH